MIRYSLTCAASDEFEGWFRSSQDFEHQAQAGLIECPVCASTQVRRAPMAPAVQGTDRGDQRARLAAIARDVQAHIRQTCDYVGPAFAQEARKRASSDEPSRPIWGEASLSEARDLIEEGVPIAPLPAPFAPTPPAKVN